LSRGNSNLINWMIFIQFARPRNSDKKGLNCPNKSYRKHSPAIGSVFVKLYQVYTSSLPTYKRIRSKRMYCQRTGVATPPVINYLQVNSFQYPSKAEGIPYS